ncbi:blr2290 [Bradyrhizobium diazoefficiens USDA 110]|uniref:Blr2290 protein n=1 Tax=Bradyrhizobium diazoefficiens (strain JCM 10833 / BCRC 13528 / IAM 13628 / NBRC 14792 / USDA 110) TaxID=224911 RepID=Q89SW0_BRADU|nr:hypothetical protein [Bradyrhizobium diazoefficiens]QBP21120.1 hypothetical protein Bdiaspc4_11725 [Bradyrhizobium diazoefficiens]QLD45936.1 hypothetical protein HUW42_35310 [Bradyrhizobium diazoefficiens]WLA72269.1 hypothetical protein QIH77_36135 [Bradyrhizobium diazoefficiens]BAC47555.1 blr2290 [Bradyrhizobium diazoefficiens USDA 110]
MNYKAILSLPILLLFAGCGTHLPELTSPQVLPRDRLIAAIHCELADAIREQLLEGPARHFLIDWQAAYTITLKGNETGTLAADANKFPVPFDRAASSVLISAGADVKGTANRTAVLKFSLNVVDIDLRAAPCAEAQATGTHPFLRGNLGFGQWLNEALDTSLSDGFIAKHPDRLTSIGHTFQFVVLATAGINPTFTIAPRPVTINPSVGVSREEDNSVDVVLAKRSSGGGGSTTVSKVKTPEQTTKVDGYRRENEQARQRIAEADALLGSPEGQRLAQLQTQIRGREAAISGVGGSVRPGLAGPNSLDLPNDLATPLQEKARRDFSELQGLKEEFAISGGANFEQQQKDRNEAERRISENQSKIQAIEADPKGVRVTRAPAAQLPPSENSNIAATQLQLTLERVIGNKLNGF